MAKLGVAAYNLWVRPNTDNFDMGLSDPPFLDYENFDYEKLHRFLKILFPFGPPVKIKVPNEVVDVLTTHIIKSHEPELLRCEIFCLDLVDRYKNTPGNVIDVRDKWQQYFPAEDRTKAPPPMLISFLVDAFDFEDLIQWEINARTILGSNTFNPKITTQMTMEENMGLFSERDRDALGELFGIPFHSEAILDRVVCKYPKYIDPAFQNMH